MLYLIAIFVNVFVLIFAGVVFIRVGLGGKIFLIATIVLSFIFPYFFRTGPTVYVLIIVTHIIRFLVGIGCYFYLKLRGDL